MSDFVYTNYLSTPESSFVDEVLYNSNSRELAVNLEGQFYVYKGIPVNEYERFVDAGERGLSVGRIYRDVKANYGPGDFLGLDHEVGLTRYITDEEDAPTVYNLVNTTTAPTTFSLTVNTLPENVKTHEHIVSFTVGDDDTVRTWSTKTDSVQRAAEALVSVGESLSLDFHVKGVYVSFE